jgi:hypothetical protein
MEDGTDSIGDMTVTWETSSRSPEGHRRKEMVWTIKTLILLLKNHRAVWAVL